MLVATYICTEARHSVFFIFSVIVHVFTFHVQFLIWVWWGAGAARFVAALAMFDSFLTFLLFGGLCPLQASVYKFLLEGRPLWSHFLTLFNTIFTLQTLCGYWLGGFWFLPGPGSLGTSKVLMLYS